MFLRNAPQSVLSYQDRCSVWRNAQSLVWLLLTAVSLTSGHISEILQANKGPLSIVWLCTVWSKARTEVTFKPRQLSAHPCYQFESVEKSAGQIFLLSSKTPDQVDFTREHLLSNSKCDCTSIVFLLSFSLLISFENYLLYQKNRCVMRERVNIMYEFLWEESSAHSWLKKLPI